ncbi:MULTISPECIES: hypothetical protein [Flavobacteriaceae]|uniref:hypothetical protein n=1 Tax=Flavobacteriaceae TaxID=49546 RepID=UPI0010AE19F5|nr:MULTISPECIES: hypothetical protein [Flavobacteriaceae]NJB38040.1 hypothetical protein [Croceivirga sp. JEA036]TKD58948.1 hypothetical protein FBT53_14880 [Flavobacterium sp. ASW18X]
MEKNLLDRKLKLIWDFKGPAAAKTAEHYEIHLKEYVSSEELKYDITGITHISDSHSLVFLVVAEFEMPQVRDDLKPHRGQVYTEPNP